MSGHGEKLTKLAPRLVAGLLAGQTFDQLATDLGVSRSTLERWMHNAAFQKLYREARRLAVEQAVGRLSATALCATETLVRHLNAGAPLVEIRAALGLLANLKALGSLDVEERLAKLEERVEAARVGKNSADGRTTP
jgi:hypothetical protein